MAVGGAHAGAAALASFPFASLPLASFGGGEHISASVGAAALASFPFASLPFASFSFACLRRRLIASTSSGPSREAI